MKRKTFARTQIILFLRIYIVQSETLDEAAVAMCCKSNRST